MEIKVKGLYGHRKTKEGKVEFNFSSTLCNSCAIRESQAASGPLLGEGKNLTLMIPCRYPGYSFPVTMLEG